MFLSLKRRNLKRSQKGFTLIELLIVIAILGILAAIAIPSMTRFIATSRIGAANGEVGMVKSAVAAAMADAGSANVTAGTGGLFALNATNDITPAASTFIQGTKAALLGSYIISTNGSPTSASTYPGTTAVYVELTGKFQ